MEKGIVLIALGSPDYIRMAYNLAISIKAAEPEVLITLVDDGKSKDYLKDAAELFDKIIECPKEYYFKDGTESYVKAKVHLYELSPYHKTLFIDSDTAWNPYKKPSDLFEQLKNVRITFKNTGYYSIKEDKGYDNNKYTYWFDMKEMLKEYSLKSDNVYQLQSEFIYFERCSPIKKFFDDAIKIYENPKVKSLIPFAGQMISDEMAFSISMALNNLKPHKINWLPTYWHFLSNDKVIENPSIFVNNYYAFSIGGTNAPAHVMKFYSNIIKRAFMKVGGIPFTIKTKLAQN